jgi:hypothetical protein
MSDYNPGPGGPYDKYGNSPYDPVNSDGRGPYILLGILVAIGLIGGLLYFNGPPRSDRANQAQAPASMTQPASPSAATPAMPKPATPAPSSTTTTPAPSDTSKQ